MRRKALLGGFLLIFIISAAFSSVYLRPAVIGPANLPTNDITDLEPGSDSEDEDTTVPPRPILPRSIRSRPRIRP